MKALLLVAITSIFFALECSSQPGQPDQAAENIRVLSWNIRMLPGIVGVDQVARARAIGDILDSSSFDVIVFQEAFHARARKEINRRLAPVFPF